MVLLDSHFSSVAAQLGASFSRSSLGQLGACGGFQVLLHLPQHQGFSSPSRWAAGSTWRLRVLLQPCLPWLVLADSWRGTRPCCHLLHPPLPQPGLEGLSHLIFLFLSLGWKDSASSSSSSSTWAGRAQPSHLPLPQPGLEELSHLIFLSLGWKGSATSCIFLFLSLGWKGSAISSSSSSAWNGAGRAQPSPPPLPQPGLGLEGLSHLLLLHLPLPLFWSGAGRSPAASSSSSAWVRAGRAQPSPPAASSSSSSLVGAGRSQSPLPAASSSSSAWVRAGRAQPSPPTSSGRVGVALSPLISCKGHLEPSPSFRRFRNFRNFRNFRRFTRFFLLQGSLGGVGLAPGTGIHGSVSRRDRGPWLCLQEGHLGMDTLLG
ncbi:uncharacterized protein LOC121362375 [Pyrgilauda ruficollis]|uniref:uncharacterized protein LOC121362375 n=1 Tax=Pyrgilauda ruficollis TaxID=221976 RepID=UPI001B86AC2C|nr:uncharacterized protein LOC121362375 [Pyrgilauda ruficollis]